HYLRCDEQRGLGPSGFAAGDVDVERCRISEVDRDLLVGADQRDPEVRGLGEKVPQMRGGEAVESDRRRGARIAGQSEQVVEAGQAVEPFELLGLEAGGL